jgi:uncharacterized protein
MSSQPTLAAALGPWVVRWRWPVLILSVALALAVASGTSHLAFNNDYRVFFSDDNPQMLAFEELQHTYTKVDNILFTFVPKESEVFDPRVLDAIEQTTLDAWQLPFALRVDSITNYQHTEATDDDLVVADLIDGGAAYDAQALERARNIAINEPLLRDFLVSHDGTATGVNITFQMPQKSMDEVPEAVAAARELVARIEAEYPVDIHLTGMVMLNNSFFEMSMRDMGTLIPAMYLVIIIVAYLMLRSLSATIGTVLVILLSLMTAMGFAGWSGVELTPPSASAPTIIMTPAVAGSIHILVTMLALMRSARPKREALSESLRLNLGPVILTSLTTAIGFLSMSFSDSPPFADLGNITSVGVLAALFYSVGFLPAFIAILPVKTKATKSQNSQLMEHFADWVVAKNRPLLGGSVAFSILLLAFVPSNELNGAFVSYFDESTVYRQDVDATSAHLTGAYQVQYSLPAPGSNGISDPAFLAQASAFVAWFRTQPEVRHVDSITDTFKRLNMNLHGDDPAYYKLPAERDLAAQYLLLYELSLPYGLDLNNRLNIDKSSTQVVVTLENIDSVRLKAVAQRGEQWLIDNAPALTTTGIGPGIMFAYIAERNIRSMLIGTFLAVILISGILLFALKSTKLGVMSLGIVVDDTVHFLSKYRRAWHEQNLNAPEAVRYAFASVGRAIVATSLVLIAGFAVLAQSDFGLNSLMALLTAISIAMALLADFLLLPALLIRFDRQSREETHSLPVEASLAAS